MPWERSAAIVAEILDGSHEAENEFATYFLPRLRAFFRARTGQPGWIDDLTQETLLRSLEALRAGRLLDSERLGAFVLGIARNRCAEAFRQGARQPAASLDEAEALASSVHAPAEERLTVRKVMDALDSEDRRLLWLLLVEGYRPAEVSQMVRLSEEAIRQRKSRLLKRLAQALGIRPAPGSVTSEGGSATKKMDWDKEG
ncbi:MAG: sigma-70 family RNA polymerase sigma factor [Acidobacteria bacterium]|nr:sigma-70 family RNA polymerase sigma factor [Acidobacteriota bacterium]